MSEKEINFEEINLDEISLEERTTEAYEKLVKSMPSIGFISRKKRIKGYIQITDIAQYMIKNEEITGESALYIFSVMMRKCANFQKAAMMTALSLNTIGTNVISPIGLNFVIDVRKNLNLAPTHHSEMKTITPAEEDDQV